MPDIDPAENKSNTENMRVTIPEAKYAPEPEETPEYKLSTENFAGNKETCQKVAELVWGFNEDFTSRGQWEQFRKDCDMADELMRAAKSRTELNSQESDNVVAAKSSVKSATFAISMRAITAGEASVILGNQEELPVEFAPLADSYGWREDEGQQQAEDKNAYLSWVISRTNMRHKIRQALFRINKYGNQPVEMYWDYRKTKKKIRIPFGQYNEKTDMLLSNGGKAKGIKKKDMVFVEREMTVADNPDFRFIDNKDFRHDVAIDDIQQQSCVIIREQMQLCDIWKLQRTNQLMNVGKVNRGDLYVGEGKEDFLENRQSNAGDSEDSETPNNLFDIWRGWVRVPIDPETGKWEPEKILPQWYEFWFAGDLETNKPSMTCLRLAPHYDECIPVEFVHAMDDDKGGIHVMHAKLVSSLMAQEMTCMDQYFDNNTLRNRKPWIMEPGAVKLRNFTFSVGGNQVFIKRPGAPDPHEIEVQDTTQQTAQVLGTIDNRIKAALGTNKPFLGEPLGSRTSASEAITDFEQSLKPALEDAKYKAEQLLPFIARWVDRMAELFADPEQVILTTYNQKQVEVKPAMMYGPMTYRVTSVKKFQDNAIRERLDNQFMSSYFAIAQPLMGQNAVVPLKQIAKNKGYVDVDEWFPEAKADYDAVRVAKNENTNILLYGELDSAQPDENHKAHLSVHEPELTQLTLVSKETRAANGIMEQAFENFKVHVQQHKNFLAQGETGQQAQMAPAQPESSPNLPGEAAGDDIAAGFGEVEGIPEQGRPPEINEMGAF